jgi:dynein heavy chain
MARHNRVDQAEVDALVKKEIALEPPHQAESLKFIPESMWGAVKGLESIKTFEHLISSMESEALQWRKWFQEQEPEVVELPRAMKDISLFHRILLLRALRPDRLTNALKEYIRDNLGADYIE